MSSGKAESAVTDLKKCKLQDLKQVAKQLSVDTKGNKNDLVLRLGKCDPVALSRAVSALPVPSNVASASSTQVNQQPHSSIPFCPVCEKRFTHKSGEESIQCEGTCQAWLHRCCAGLSKSEYDLLSGYSVPFCCVKCRLQRAEEKISTLQTQVDDLFDRLNTQVASAHSSALSNGTRGISSPGLPITNSGNGGLSWPPDSFSRTHLSSNHSTRKFNLVFHNIPESPASTSFTDRLKHDFDAVYAAIDSSVVPKVQDCVRLGRFRADAHSPRPVLARFSDTRSVHTVLAKPLQSGVVVKWDLSKENRQINSVLLKERYRLITEENVVKRSIKFCGNKLFVDGRLHGSVCSGVFVLAPTSTHNNSDGNLTSGNSSNSGSPEIEHVPTSSPGDESLSQSDQSSLPGDD
uniref:Zinc finger PHD-type domain-containing protein n=1 Tax=Amphimedon queenslandica TaxID=400682 RepID=A0A1X7U4B7_AMPQE